jgi:hypothetical protein
MLQVIIFNGKRVQSPKSERSEPKRYTFFFSVTLTYFLVGGMNSGFSGLKALGVRDLSYKMAFMACFAQPAETKVRIKSL